MDKSKKAKQELIRKIAELDIENYSVKHIANKLSLSPQRIYQIYKDDEYINYLAELEDSQKELDNDLSVELSKYKKSLVEQHQNYLSNEFSRFLSFNEKLQRYAEMSGNIYEDIATNILASENSESNLIAAKSSNFWLQNIILLSNQAFENLNKIAGVMAKLEKSSDEKLKQLKGEKSNKSLSDKLDSLLDEML